MMRDWSPYAPKWNIETVKVFFKKFDCTLLSEKWEGTRSKVEYICPNGHVTASPFRHLSNGPRCQQCFNERRGHNRRTDLEDAIKLVSSFGYKNIKIWRTSLGLRLRYFCSVGQKNNETSFSHFKSGKRCRCCCLKKGAEHHAWNPNRTNPQRVLARQLPEYHAWRKSVWTRDDFTCVKCGSHGSETPIVAHHIENYSTAVEKRLALENGVTLCKPCHLSFHNFFGRLNNNILQLVEWIPQP